MRQGLTGRQHVLGGVFYGQKAEGKRQKAALAISLLPSAIGQAERP